MGQLPETISCNENFLQKAKQIEMDDDITSFLMQGEIINDPITCNAVSDKNANGLEEFFSNCGFDEITDEITYEIE